MASGVAGGSPITVRSYVLDLGILHTFCQCLEGTEIRAFIIQASR